MTQRITAFQIATLSLALIGGLQAQDKATKPDPNIEAAKRPLALLDSAPWQDIFNGKDLTGWTGDTTGHVVKDGVLVCQKGAKSLETEKD
jgi:hypothetical protein